MPTISKMKRYSKKFKNGQFVRTITEDKYNNCRGYIESHNKYNKDYLLI